MQSLALTLVLTAGLAATAPAMAEAVVGQPAPAFAGADLAGKPLSLSDFKLVFGVFEALLDFFDLFQATALLGLPQ